VLESFSPAAGATNVPVDATIQFTFDEIVDQDFQVSFQLGGAALTVTPQLSSGGKTVTIPVPTAIAVPATASVTFSGLKDRFGNEMDPQPHLEWTYPDWFPRGAQQTSVESYFLAAAASGPILAWHDGATTMAVRRWSNSSWETLASPGTGSSFSFTVDPAGAPVVAFYSGGRPHVTRYAEGAWTELGNALPSQTLPTIGTAVGYESGEPVVAFGNGYHVECSQSGSCSAPVYPRMYLYRLRSGTWAQRGSASLTTTGAPPITALVGDGTGVMVAWSASVRRMADASTTFANYGTPGGDVTMLGVNGGAPLGVGNGVVRGHSGGNVWYDLGTTSGVVSLYAVEGVAPLIATRTEASGTYTVTFCEWNGDTDTWDQLGAAVTGSATETRSPRIAAGPDGTIYRAINGVVSALNR